MRVIAEIATNWSSRRGAGHSRPAAVADLACLETVYFGAVGAVGGGGRGARRLQRRAGRHHGGPAARAVAVAMFGLGAWSFRIMHEFWMFPPA